ncbi:MAG: ABC transporter substrate-binding protein [Hyphomicrobiales bacterium]|nr:ABC transporter substrate-binding protein [Hyphomicrobiales bacterium]
MTPTSVKIGQTIPLSGPVSAYATFSRASLAFYDMINQNGGIGGRKIELLSVDDSFSPPKTVEQTRKLVEGDQVFAIVAPMGGTTAKAVQKYLNDKKVPQFLIQSSLPYWNNPKEFPWSISGLPDSDMEVSLYARFLLKKNPQARVAVLYQNDDFGRAYLTAMTADLKGTGASVVASEAFDLTEPTVDSHIVRLAASKADTLLIGATARQTIQTLKKAAELGWKPQYFIAYPAANIERTYKVAGVELAKGAISSSVFKDPGDPAIANDRDLKDYFAFMEKYYPKGDRLDTLNVAAFVEGEIFAEVLRRCGANLSRKTFLDKATSLGGWKAPMLRDAVIVRTDPGNYDIFRSMQLLQFDGTRNEAIAVPN